MIWIKSRVVLLNENAADRKLSEFILHTEKKQFKIYSVKKKRWDSELAYLRFTMQQQQQCGKCVWTKAHLWWFVTQEEVAGTEQNIGSGRTTLRHQNFTRLYLTEFGPINNTETTTSLWFLFRLDCDLVLHQHHLLRGSNKTDPSLLSDAISLAFFNHDPEVSIISPFEIWYLHPEVLSSQGSMPIIFHRYHIVRHTKFVSFSSIHLCSDLEE